MQPLCGKLDLGPNYTLFFWVKMQKFCSVFRRLCVNLQPRRHKHRFQSGKFSKITPYVDTYSKCKMEHFQRVFSCAGQMQITCLHSLCHAGNLIHPVTHFWDKVTHTHRRFQHIYIGTVNILCTFIVCNPKVFVHP